jgi:putative DNA methylase
MTAYKKKLIEVALPLEAINKASAREKSIRHGHPSTLHLWWARRPLAAARAVIFAQMVDDPSTYVADLGSDAKLLRKAESVLNARLKLWEDARTLAKKAKQAGLPVTEPGPAPTIEDVLADLERQRLFRIIEDLVLWENTTNETVLQAARDEIWQSWRRACAENADHPRAKELFDRKRVPAFHDPFAGGGALPLEAQRLGLESYASDLNPVAVLICKAMIEIPPKFAGRPPVRPRSKDDPPDFIKRQWRGAQGLAEDVRYYGRWMRDEAEKRIGHLYPKVEVTAEMVRSRPDLKGYLGKELTVIAWLWARTVKSPNPAFAQVDVPLASTFMLSTKPGKEAYVEPVIENGGYRFTVKVGKPKDAETARNGTKLARGANFQCLMSGTPMEGDYIKAEGKAGRMGARLMGIVAEGKRGRVYLAPTPEHEAAARKAKPEWKPDVTISGSTQYLGVKPYGMDRFGQLFTDRQLVALTTFSDLVQEARERVKDDALATGILPEGPRLDAGGAGATAYADAVAVYLASGVSRLANRLATICIWNRIGEKIEQVFARQAIPMTWDFAEANAFSDSTGGWAGSLEWVPTALETLPHNGAGAVTQDDAATQSTSEGKLVSTDPPYFDNVPYADLSDFFYVWLRRSLRQVYPDLFSTLAVPKTDELVAFAYRHADKGAAGAFFMDGMTRAMHRLAEQGHPAFPVTIYYAFRQSETDDDEGTSSTGWETFLDAVIQAGFDVTGTWPVRTERGGGMRNLDRNSLASSIVLVCRPRAATGLAATRREFLTALKAELPDALMHLQHGNIAPVDLAQAAIGPGMAVYTRYAKVLDADGKTLSVREALTLINQTLDEALAGQEGDFDADSRWALAWFEQSGFDAGEYGVAETLSKAKNTSVSGMVEAGILASKGGKVRLLRPAELPADWNPETDLRLTAWESVHHLVRVLESGGESAAAELVAKLGAKAEIARELAYRLYALCERKKRAADALAYNGLVQSWPEIVRLARDGGKPTVEQGALFGETEE